MFQAWSVPPLVQLLYHSHTRPYAGSTFHSTSFFLKKTNDETDPEFKPRGQVPSLKSGVIKVQPAGQVWGSWPVCVKFHWDTLTFSDIVHMVAFMLQQS